MKWQPTLVLLLGKFHGWRSVVGYSPWGCKESDLLSLKSWAYWVLNPTGYKEYSVACFQSWCCLVAKSYLTLCDSMGCSMPGFLVLHYLSEFTQTHVIESVMASSLFILCHPLLLPSIFPSIRVFSNELAHPIRGTKYWSFLFSISPFNEYSELISFRNDWFDLFAD